jgi:riboflavin biosynthesis pyrimidine reductase
VASRPETDAPLDLLGAPGVTLVLPEDAGPAGEGIATWRLGQGGRVDLGALVGQLAGQTVALEGGPTLAGLLAAQGLVDELFLTLAPRVVGGSSPRVVHGAESPPGPWSLEQGLVDGEGFVYLRYHRPEPHLV